MTRKDSFTFGNFINSGCTRSRVAANSKGGAWDPQHKTLLAPIKAMISGNHKKFGKPGRGGDGFKYVFNAGRNPWWFRYFSVSVRI